MPAIGRPLKEAKDKKHKIHIAVDYEVYEYLKTLENKSEFMNKAAWILLRAYRKSSATARGQNGQKA